MYAPISKGTKLLARPTPPRWRLGSTVLVYLRDYGAILENKPSAQLV